MAAVGRMGTDGFAHRSVGVGVWLRDRGSATAEMAVLLPALAALLALSTWSVAAVSAQLRCVDAARTAARAFARGEPPELALAAARAAAPHGAAVDIARQPGVVVVEVKVRTRLPGPWGAGAPGIDIGSRAVAAVEE